MNKLYALPISLFLLHPVFAEDIESNSASVIPQVAISQPEIAQNEEQDDRLEIDPMLLQELQAEIAAMIEEKDLVVEREEVAYYAEEEEMMDEEEEEEFTESEVVQLPAPPRAQRSISTPKAQNPQKSDEQLAEVAPGSHVRRFTTKPSQAPRQQEKIADAAPAVKQQPPAVRRQAARPLKTPKVQREIAGPEAEQGAVKKQAPRARSQIRQKSTADAQSEQQSQSTQKKQPAPRQTPGPRVQSPEATQSTPPQNKPKPKQAAPTKKPDVKVQAPPVNKQDRAQARAESSKRAPNASPSAAAQSKKIAMTPTPQNNTQPAPAEMPKSQNKMNGKMYNTATRPVIKDGYNLWVMGDALLWQAVEENLTYVYTGNDTPTQSNRNLHTVDFNWDWGFRLGAGYNAPRDGWDFDLYWTHIRNTADDKQHAHADKQLYQVWSVANQLFPGTISDAKAHWQVNLDQVDLELGRQFFVGNFLTVRPFVGLRSAWIFQKYDTELKGAVFFGDILLSKLEQEAKLRNKFWGFGFVTGLDSDWRLGKGFSIYGDADMSILMSYFDVDQNATLNDIDIWSQDKSFRTGRVILDLGLGIKWATLFYGDRLGLTFKAGYEYHLYFNQNQFVLSSGNSNFELFNPVKGDLTYQGVIGSIQFDF